MSYHHVGGKPPGLTACTLSQAATAAEREAFIVECGCQLEQEYTQGNRQAAEAWQQAMFQAIRERSHARVTQLEEGYFGTDGGALSNLTAACK